MRKSAAAAVMDVAEAVGAAADGREAIERVVLRGRIERERWRLWRERRRRDDIIMIVVIAMLLLSC